ncbi:MAG: glycogen synthase GlgA [Atopobiaceae bacterium]|nr:glycogen synthase GlgA [Atopobiaceae bacterium]
MSQNRRKLNVIFAASEAVPFSKTGGLADVAGSLPMALAEQGCNVRVITPKYGFIDEEYRYNMKHVCDFFLPLSWRNVWCGIDEIEYKGITFDFIDNEDYFKRDRAYSYFDDGERFAFFAKAVTEAVRRLPDFKCDILHLNDWQTALAPVFLKESYADDPLYENVRTVYTIHNLKFQGEYSSFVMHDICGFEDSSDAGMKLTSASDTINYMKGGSYYADVLTTVSPSYADEIQDPFFGERLDGLFRERRDDLHGILNGIDVDEWNPETDPMIAQNYSMADMSGKAVCKAQLQEELGLTVDPLKPLVVMVGRLTKQKGMDLINYAMDEMVGRGVQIAILGTGDKTFEDSLNYFAWKYPGKVAARIDFDNALSHRMYAGADLFLMPSLFEPCGLSQMISMRYGTLPVVRETGGLRDSVIPYNKYTGEGTGFGFRNFNATEMKDILLSAADVFWNNTQDWERLQRQAMEADFSWSKAAQEYVELYWGLVEDAEKVAAEKVAAKKSAAKEAEAKKAEAVKTAAKKPAAKKSATKKAAPKKAAAAKADETQAAEKKTAAKKTAAKKATAKKSTAKKATTKKSATKKPYSKAEEGTE